MGYYDSFIVCHCFKKQTSENCWVTISYRQVTVCFIYNIIMRAVKMTRRDFVIVANQLHNIYISWKLHCIIPFLRVVLKYTDLWMFWLLFFSFLGQRFAMLELKVIISGVINRFKLLPVDEEPKLCNEIVLRSQNGVKIRLEQR